MEPDKEQLVELMLPKLVSAMQPMIDALVADIARYRAEELEASKNLIAKWRAFSETVDSPLQNVYRQCADELEASLAAQSSRGGLLHFRAVERRRTPRV